MKRFAAILSLILFATLGLSAQDWIRTGTGLGVEKIRLAAPDFKQITTDSGTNNLATTFNTTLQNDLQNAGIFEMVSRSFWPTSLPGAPQEVHLADWSSPPPNANMLAFGNLGVQGGSLMCRAGSSTPRIRSRRRCWASSIASRRPTRMRGSSRIASPTKSSCVWAAAFPASPRPSSSSSASRSGSKEIWQMDYDGANQKQLTHLGSIALSPHVSPDGTRVAFSGVTKEGWQILMYSLDLNRLVSFPHFPGDNYSPAWSSDGQNIAFSSSRTGNTEIYSGQLDWRQSSPADGEQGTGCFADVEPED